MKIVMWILGIILLSPFYGASQQIRFEAVRQNVILNIDQQNFVDLVVHHDKAFLLASRWNAHSFYRGRSFVMIDLAKAPENENEYYSAIPEGYYSLFGLTYQSDMYYLPEEEKLQDRIVQINDALHLPDRSDCSHHFTLTGDYLGKFPDFSNLENQYQDVKIKGEPIQFPADIFGEVYTAMIQLESFVLLLNDSKYTIVSIDELNQWGEDAPHQTYERKIIVNRRGYEEQQILFFPMQNNYFLVEDKLFGGYRLYKALPQNFVHEYTDVKFPKMTRYNWSTMKNGVYYQVEPEGSFLIKLVQYRVSGLVDDSGAGENIWRQYH